MVALAFVVFVLYPGSLDIATLDEIFTTAAIVIGIALGVGAVLTVYGGVKAFGSLASSIFPSYNVAEVEVDGPIMRDGGRSLPTSPGVTPADDIVEQIELADEDSNADALLLKLNTPGGQVVPSDDIRLAAEEFDGPTIAYATDLCASGGYWIASVCDEIYARDTSIVGSIGVIGSRVNAKELADKIGLSYEQFTAGEYKDAGTPLKEMEEKEREYLQGIIDEFYDAFIRRVAGTRNLTEEEVRETEARVYLGDEALEVGLVDSIGTREDVKEKLAEKLGVDEAKVRKFEPEKKLTEKVRIGAQGVAYSFGAGLGSVVTDAEIKDFEFRLR
ncbi:MAG: signal peptide peptidase SppA [Halobacteria archaeon]|nr:signal peptide peptidase SppA [Halobacteria archaeon]